MMGLRPESKICRFICARTLKSLRAYDDKLDEMQRVLLVEDDVVTRTVVCDALDEVCDVQVAPTLEAARHALRAQTFDLTLFDIQLPDGSGFAFFAEIQSQLGRRAPAAFFLTSSASDGDKVLAFSLGAEDYITKPFSVAELKARVQSRLKKIGSKVEREQIWQGGGLHLNLTRHRAQVRISNGGEEGIDLSPTEFKLVWYLVQNEGRVISRRQIIDHIWGNATQIVERTVDVHLSNLRKKLQRTNVVVESVSGSGYVLRAPAAGKVAA